MYVVCVCVCVCVCVYVCVCVCVLCVCVWCRVYEMELRLETPVKFQHPCYEVLTWFAARNLLKEIKGVHHTTLQLTIRHASIHRI